METPPASPCAAHPGAATSFVCTRCGSFACEACRNPASPGWCAACHGRVGPQLAVGEVLSLALRLLRARWATVAASLTLHVAALALFFVLLGNPDWLVEGDESAGFGLALAAFIGWNLLFHAVTNGPLLGALADAAEGRSRPLARALVEDLQRFPSLLALACLTWTGVLAASAFCLVPGLLLAAPLSLATPAVVVDGLGPLAALRASWAASRRVRTPLFALVLLTTAVLVACVGVPTALATVSADAQALAGISLLVLVPGALTLMQVLSLAAHLRLRGVQRTDAPAPAALPLPVG